MKKVFVGPTRGERYREVKDVVRAVLVARQTAHSELWLSCDNSKEQNSNLRINLWRALKSGQEKQVVLAWTEKAGKEKRQIKFNGTVAFISEKNNGIIILVKVTDERQVWFQAKRYGPWQRETISVVANLWRRAASDRDIRGGRICADGA